MSRDSTPPAPPNDAPQPNPLRLGPLMDLLEAQDPALRRLFAKALNIFAAPGAEALPEREKLDHLKQAIEESLTQASPSC